ncbi:33 kDa chaperonin [bioreactor metagenome]|uniref:33 kDa chaperonin n=1 Tax=bioreactor metagenome TaxID=1076179 RepID=A0A645C4G2_9ZZZZ|nr:Hsp33 family molecular chaperone HslO [Lachnospiraceae bacterium]
MSDYILRATAADGNARIFIADAKETVEKARSLHNTTPVATAALGRTLIAAGIMGSMLKGKDDIVTLQIKGDGPLGGIVVTSDAAANVRGYVHNPFADIPEANRGKLDVAKAIGKGTLSVAMDIGLKEPYTGQIELVSGEIAEDLAYYYAKSQQTPSSVGLGVLINTDCSVKKAGGFIVQLMPEATDEFIGKLEDNILKMPYITDLLDMEMTPYNILDIILKDCKYQIVDKIPMQYKCNCSRERVERALISLGINELKDILEKEGEAKLFCNFCNTEYKFGSNEIKSLINKKS